MKKNMFYIFIMVTVVLFMSVSSQDVFADPVSEISYETPEEVISYAEECYMDYAKFAGETGDCELGQAFIEYYGDSDAGDETWYFPVYHDGTVITTVYVIQTTEGYSSGDDTDEKLLEALNSIGDQDNLVLDMSNADGKIHMYKEGNSYTVQDGELITEGTLSEETVDAVNQYIEERHPYDIGKAKEFADSDEFLESSEGEKNDSPVIGVCIAIAVLATVVFIFIKIKKNKKQID